MKKLFGILLMMAGLAIFFQSCEKILDPQDGDEGNEGTETDLVDRLKWKVDFDEVMEASLDNPVPAIDEDSCIYVIADVKDIPAGTQIMKISPGGAVLWSKKIQTSLASRPVYHEGRLYFAVANTLYCWNANNGQEIWNVENALTKPFLALSNDRIYVTYWEDNNFLGKSFLRAYDLDGNLVWSQQIKYSDTDTINFVLSMSARDNQIYLALYQEIGESEFAIINYQDNGSGVERKWGWLAPDDFSGDNAAHFKGMAIDDDNNLLFPLKKEGKQYIFSVNAGGTQNWSVSSYQEKNISDVTVDEAGYFYTAYDRVEKLSSGSTVWTGEPKQDWEYEGVDAQPPVIAENGNLYFVNHSAILTSVKPDGSFNWEQYIYPCDLCTEEFHNLTINRNGDIIVVGKYRVYCFAGDSTNLAQHGWAKSYYDYGNTSAK